MTDDSLLIKRRFVELAKKSYNSGYFAFTNFLGLAEQSSFSEILSEIKGIKYTAFGGAEGAERVIIRFGSVEELGYEEPFPIVMLKIAPKSEKFADKLSHRDFLGSLMNLGVEREMFGDIVIINNVGYLFAKEEIADYVIDSLSKVKHTDVLVTKATELPEGELYRTEKKTVQINSERVDAVVAKVFSLSRDDSQALFKKKLVFINGKCIESASHTPKSGDVISVRGYGRMVYDGCESLSKKGKLNVSVKLYV